MDTLTAEAEALPMWDEHKRERFQQLRERENALSQTERTELALLIKELEDAEAAYLTPATERIRTERSIIETQNSRLEDLVRRKEALVRRLGQVLSEARTERQAIDHELAAVLATSSDPGR